jgi:RNA polymerase sigma factor (sigma-70 family)
VDNYQTYTDEQLLQLLKQSNEAALSDMYHRYWQFLFNVAFKILSDTEQSKDAVSDVFLYIWERRLSIEIHNLPGYLKKAVRFRAIRILTSTNAGFFELFDSVENSPYRPDKHLLDKEFLQLIESWANLLPVKRRKIFIKHFFEGLNTKEIAQQLNISQKTVQNQLGTSTTYLYSRFRHLLTIFFAFF